MDLNLLIDVVWKLGTLMGFGWMYLANRNKVTNARITELKEDIDVKMDEHSDRLARLEQDNKHAPTLEDLGRLHQRIDDVAGAIKHIEGHTAAQTRTLDLIHQHLLNRPGG